MKCLKVVNSVKFKEWLNGLKDTELDKGFRPEDSNNIVAIKLGKIIGANYRTILRWFKDEKPKVSSDLLMRIFDKFPKLKFDDLGVKEYDETEPNVFSKRFNELLKEKNISINDISKKLNVDKSAVSHWKNGKNIPTMDKLIELAKLFKVNVEYLAGTSNIKSIENLDQKVIQLLNVLSENNPNTLVEFYGELYTIQELEENYFDISKILINNKLLGILRDEITRVVEYHINYSTYNSFENTINEREGLGQTVSYIQNCSARDIAHLNINKAIDEAFDNFVNQELMDAGLSTTDIDRPDIYHINKVKKIKKKSDEK